MKSFHEGQLNVLRKSKRFNTLACGRRWGKTSMGLIMATMGWPGHAKSLISGYDVGWFAPTDKIFDEVWELSVKVFQNQGMIDRKNRNIGKIWLKNKSAMHFWSLDKPDQISIGVRYGVVIIDEAGKAKKLAKAWPAIRPALSDFSGGAWFMGTPKGRNFFWKQTLNADLYPEAWAHHTAPTWSNPYIPRSEILAAQNDLSQEMFEQEYLAKFINDEGGVFRNIRQCIDDELTEGLQSSFHVGDGRSYVIGIDWARHRDFTVFVVIDARLRAVVAIERYTQIEYSFQLSKLQALRKRFPHAHVIAEENSIGSPLIEQLRKAGVTVTAFTTTAISKAQIIEKLQLAFEQGDISIPDVPWLIDELIAFEQSRMPSGFMRYAAPEGGTDDGVMALAIGWHAIEADPGRVVHVESELGALFQSGDSFWRS